MNVVLALDSAMGIFNNVPPRVNYCELDLQLPCHPEYFELSSHAEMLGRASFPRTRMRLIEAFQKLFVDPEELRSAFQHEILGCWDMLYLIHGRRRSRSSLMEEYAYNSWQSSTRTVGHTYLEIRSTGSHLLPWRLSRTSLFPR